MILPPRPAHALSGWYAVARSKVTPLRPLRDALPVILPPPVEYDDGDLPAMPWERDYELCDCRSCGDARALAERVAAMWPEVTP